MRYLSVCAGIEAATVAWHPLGWQPVAFSEIEPFAAAVLRHHWPEVPLVGDFRGTGGHDHGAVDVVVGGTPCQDFSVAGLRKGLAGERGNLTLEFLRLVGRTRPRWVVWENVPGVLSLNQGRSFGAVLGGLAQLGYGTAYRILDAQYFGLAQRRQRVFVVGYLGDWRPPAAVLFERESLSGHPAPRRQTGQGTARSLAAGSQRGSGYRNDADTADNLVATVLRARDQAKGVDSDATDTLIAHTLKAAMHAGATEDGTGRGVPLVVATLTASHGPKQSTGNQAMRQGFSHLVPHVSPTLEAGHNATGGVRPPGSTVDTADSLVVVGSFQQNNMAGRGTVGWNGDGDDPLRPVKPQADHQFLVLAHGQANDEVSEDIAPTLTLLHETPILFAEVADPLTANEGRTYTHEGRNNFRLRNEPAVVAFAENQRGEVRLSDVALALNSGGGKPGEGYQAALSGAAVRRLTPRECERLQGFPDDYTLIPWRNGMAADGPRYRVLGNSMAVPVMRWLGERIEMVEKLVAEGKDRQ